MSQTLTPSQKNNNRIGSVSNTHTPHSKEQVLKIENSIAFGHQNDVNRNNNINNNGSSGGLMSVSHHGKD